MPPDVVTAASAPWPAIVIGVVVVVAACLWLLFRPGSIGDRARSDDATGADGTDGTGHDGGIDQPPQSPGGGR